MSGVPAGRNTIEPGLFAGIAAIAALGAASFCWLRPTNFRGYDEWLIFWMLSRGLVSFPHADRPLGLVWHLPAWWLAPDRLWGLLLVHAAWLTGAGILTFLLVRRWLPAAGVAFLAGAFTVAWMPSELARIASVQMIQYSGAAAGALGAAWLLVEASQRRSAALLALAGGLGVATALSLEATLPLLAAAPLLLLTLGHRGDRRRRLLWISGALTLVAAAGARLLVPLLAGRGPSYQTGILGAVRTPRGTLRQMAEQFQHHLLPLFEPPGEGLAHAPVAVAVLVFVAGFVLVRRLQTQPASAGEGRAKLLCAALVGLAAAALGYLPFALARAIRTPERTEFLAAPGIALALAALLTLAVSFLPARARAACACVLGAWVVAVGSSRTLAQQRQWHEGGVYAAQRRMLQSLAELAPAVEPHSLVVLLQRGRAWTFEFSATKAIEYLYHDEARGSAAGTVPALHDTRFEAGGIVSEPAPALRSGWLQPVECYRYDEALVFAEDAVGRLVLLESWPAEDLGPLPPETAYAPRARIRQGPRRSERFAILAPEP
jgi:hypothetical protein